MPKAQWRPLRAKNCDVLIGRIRALADAIPPLDLTSHEITAHLVTEPSPLDDRAYKHREDLIDACLAAWTALLWHHRSGVRCQVLGREDPLVDDGGRRATIIAPRRRKIPPGGYLEVPMSEEFVLEGRERGTDQWWGWGELRSEWFQRADDGSYVCTDHGGPPIYIRALSIDDAGIIDHVDAGGYGDVGQLRLVTGASYAGSQLQTQLYVNRRTQQLDDAIREQFADLQMATIEWRSPLVADNYREYWDKAFLRRLDLERHEPELAAFWPTGGPHWDALGLVHRPGEERPGVLLVEGKSYPKELFGSGTAAKPGSESRKLIEQSLGWTQRQLAVTTKSPRDWCGRLYQSANRLAHLCWLQSLGLSAWLVHLLFTEDRHQPTSAAQWRQAIDQADVELGISVTIPHAGHAILPAGTRDELISP